MKIKLEPFEVQMAADVATRRFVENLKMGKSFSYGYQGSEDKTLALGIMGCCAEVAFAKSQNQYFNGSYSDKYSRYTDTDMQKGIEIRSQKRKPNNFLLIRPNEKKAKYVLVIDEGGFEFSLIGWYSFIMEEPDRLTNFGYPNRPPAYKVDIKELRPIADLKC
tara:strand:+ start:60 stop:548 length:489 start_codon:yes stop_codon:yes gene_type:complete